MYSSFPLLNHWNPESGLLYISYTNIREYDSEKLYI